MVNSWRTSMLVTGLCFVLSVGGVVQSENIDHLEHSDLIRYQNAQKSELRGISWQLVKFQSSDDSTLTPDDKGKYTIKFDANGQVSVRLDCNRGGGSWRSSAPNQLRFGPLRLTRAKCAPGSLHDQIAKNWKFVRSYVFKDGHLFLSLRADGGIYEFEPMVLSGETESLFGKRWRLTEIEGAAVKTTKAYIEFDRDAQRFSGDAGCNRIAGNFEINGTNIKFSQAISTRMACMDNEVQQIETEFLKALEATTRFEIQDNVLRFYQGDQSSLTFRSGQLAHVTGTITYRQRIALTPNAVIEVKLLDVSRADAAAVTIAEQIIKPAGRQVPIAFDLSYDASTIKERNRYAIQVRILENNQLRFINSQAYLVITGGHPTTVTVLMKPIH